jgi:excisionase family DNA binding protein
MIPMNAAKFTTIEGFAQRYAVGRSTVYNLLSDGVISAVKCGAKTLISMKSGEKWAASLPPAAINCRRTQKA